MAPSYRQSFRFERFGAVLGQMQAVMKNSAKKTEKKQDRRVLLGAQRRARTRARIISSAFDLYGTDQGSQLRVEDVARSSGVTRATFYSYFNNLHELREAVAYELIHDIFARVVKTHQQLDDPAVQVASAIRFYLRKARSDRQWAQSVVNISANGQLFGAETFHRAEENVQQGLDAGRFKLWNSELGRDIVLGTCLAAMCTIIEQETPDIYPELVAGHVLMGLGLELDEARSIATDELPPLAELD
jgi:AcrR family transcriptional regulator